MTALVFCLLFLASLSGFFLWRYRRRFPAETQAVNIVFMGLAVSAIRHLPLLALVTAPVLVEGAAFLEKEVRLIKSGPDRLKKAGKVFLVLTAVFFVLDASLAFRGSYLLAEGVFYPRKAVDFLAADLPSGEIFSDYGWGGYLIWKLPQKKVFIDGRMSHWPGILKKFSQIVSGKEAYQPVFAQYNIDTVLWPVAKDSREVKLLTRLREDGWQEVYRDKIALILRKPK